MKYEESKKICDLLNRMFKTDPATIKSLLMNRLPCSKQTKLDSSITGSDNSLSALGLINILLSTLDIGSIVSLKSRKN